jgi:hypothetical protein
LNIFIKCQLSTLVSLICDCLHVEAGALMRMMDEA